MARLFGKEYHDVSNTWYFKDKLIPFKSGDLLYQVTENERGMLVFRFTATPQYKKYYSADVTIFYDPVSNKIVKTDCHCCSQTINQESDRGCIHYLSTINYGYKYLSTNIISSVKSTIYTNTLTEYNDYWQKEAKDGKLFIEGIYDKNSDKIRFHFSGYHDIELYLISLLAAGKEIPPAHRALKSLLKEQLSALDDAEVSCLGLLQSIKCAHSAKKKCWTIYKKKFVKTFTCLKSLADKCKVYVKETGELLRFTDSPYSLSLKVSKNDISYPSKQVPAYVMKPGPGCFISAFYTGNFTYLFVENIVYSLRLPLRKQVIEDIFSGGFYFGEKDLIYIATVVAKQLADVQYKKQTDTNKYEMQGCYIDFDEDIVIPKHFANEPRVTFNLTKSITKDKGIKVECHLDYGERELPVNFLYFQSNLVAVGSSQSNGGNEDRKDNGNDRFWFYIPIDIQRKINRFLKLMPIPDREKLGDKGYYLYQSEIKIDRLKQVFYENVDSDWVINLDDQLKKEFIHRVDLNPVIKVKKSDDISWFDYDVEYKVAEVTITHQELQIFFRKNSKYLKLPDGKLVYFSNRETFFRIDNHLSGLKSASKQTMGMHQRKQGDLLTHYNLAFLYTLARNDSRIKIHGDKYLEEMYSDLLKRKMRKEVEVPLSLYNVMRGYQKRGFKWLKMLQEYKLGGVLADDMGLGKTLQAIAILADYYEDADHKSQQHASLNINAENMPSVDNHLPSLVVCPKTLLFNWGNEIEKFHSNLTYTIYEGKKLERQKILHELRTDIIIVSYALINSDCELFDRFNYAYIILDEAQHIKNPQSLRTKAVKKLKSEYRLALTGTPLENNLIELWSIYDFLMPGYLHSLRKFKNLYAPPYAASTKKNKDKQNPLPLHQVVSPFMLRRKKKDVLLELPDKQEQLFFCRLTPQQEKTYLKIIAMVKKTYLNVSLEESEKSKTVKAKETTKKLHKPQVYVNLLAALTRLRQVCNHPGFVNPDLLDKSQMSGKMELLSELIQDAVENGRNTLVFSQFATMLKEIARMLEDKKLPFEYMDGQTTKRQQKIDNFCTNDDIQLFLLTLKVGGLGLNLTKADTVILVDPWWNPMAENQSIDRAHRIGQTKKVMVYKIITKGTVEEKILQLQQHKKGLFNNIIEDSQEVIKNLTVNDMEKLFDYNES